MKRPKFLPVLHTILDHHVMGGGFSLDSEKSFFSKAHYFDIYFFHGFFLAAFLYTGWWFWFLWKPHLHLVLCCWREPQIHVHQGFRLSGSVRFTGFNTVMAGMSHWIIFRLDFHEILDLAHFNEMFIECNNIEQGFHLSEAMQSSKKRAHSNPFAILSLRSALHARTNLWQMPITQSPFFIFFILSHAV